MNQDQPSSQEQQSEQIELHEIPDLAHVEPGQSAQSSALSSHTRRDDESEATVGIDRARNF